MFQVIKKYQLTNPSMEQLQNCYFFQYSEQLPLTQYMALYDNVEAGASPKSLPTKAEPAAATADPNAGTSQKSAGRQTGHHPSSCREQFLVCADETTTPLCPSTASNGLTEKQQQQRPDTTSDLLSSLDFPELGAKSNATKGQKRKVAEAVKKEGGFPVFKDSYHAQLREVHGDNVRAVQSLQEDDEELTGKRRRGNMSPEKINSLMEDVIREIAAEGELVTEEKVRGRGLFGGLVTDRPYLAGR